MRDDQGDLLPNAHLIGFFRRICKLLFHNIRPVFVFDGSTPALKRRTVAERRRRREQQESRVRKTAERLLLNRLKQHALNTIEAQPNKDGAGQSSAPQSVQNAANPPTGVPQTAPVPTEEQEAVVDEGGPSGTVPVEDAGLAAASTGAGSAAKASESESDGDDFEFEPLLPEGDEEVDPVVLATLPPSMQLEVMLRLRDRRTMANRSGFEERTGRPEAFSQFQMQQYLRASTLRHQLNVLQGAGAPGGEVPRPIAGEEGREYVLTADTEVAAATPVSEGVPSAAIDAPAGPSSGSPATRAEPEGATGIALSFVVTAEDVLSDESMEWEDVDDVIPPPDGAGGPSSQPNGSQEGAGSQHWRERMARRHKYWSLSHGFQRGKKLGDWGKEGEESPEEDPEKSARVVGADEEDAQLQEAIRRSLSEPRDGMEDMSEPSGSDVDVIVDLLAEDGVDEGARELGGDSECVPTRAAGVLGAEGEPPAASPPVADTSLPTDNVSVRPREPSAVPTAKALQIEEGVIQHAAARTHPVPVARAQQTGVPVHKITPPAAVIEKEEQPSPSPAATTTHGAEVTVLEEESDWEDITEADAEAPLLVPALPASQVVNSTTAAVQKKAVRFADDVTEVPSSKPEQSASEVSLVTEEKEEEVMVAVESEDAADGGASQQEVEPTQQVMPQTIETSTHSEFPQPSPRNVDIGAGSSTSHAGGAPPSEPIAWQTYDPEELRREEASLRVERRAAAGQSDTPTDVMYAECQELLHLFGIPYIIAPSEAEAQCAWLDAAGLVDGVVTDDNDAFLFGARRVYRHIFEDKKYVEEYRTGEIESELGLERDRLVALALLLGSDYTPGVAGVGVVNAVEVVHAFRGVEALRRFARWAKSLDEEIMALARAAGGASADPDDEASDAEAEREAEFKQNHRGVKKGWTLPSDFPSAEVIDAYTHPKVDDAKDKFAFARPDIQLLRQFCEERFGWEHARTDELLVPVLKAYDERQTQQTLDNFVAYRQRFAKIRSKRLQKVGRQKQCSPHFVIHSLSAACPLLPPG